MATDDNIIDIRSIVFRYLRNWYWFLISVILCVGVALFYIFATPFKYEVSSEIMMRSAESSANNVLASDLNMLAGTGITEDVEDELEILNSRAIMQQVIRTLDIQTSYKKKDGLRWIEQYPNRNVSVVYEPGFNESIRFVLEMRLTRKEDGYKLKVEYGKDLSSKHTFASLQDTIETCAGKMTFTEHSPMEVGDVIEIVNVPMSVRVAGLQAAISAKQVKKDSRVVKITTTTDATRKAEDIINLIVDLYNQDAVYDRSYMAQETKSFVDERLRVVSSELDSLEKIVEEYKQQKQIANIGNETQIYLQNTSRYQEKIVEIETQIGLLTYIKNFVFDEANANKQIPANLGVTDGALLRLIDTYNNLELDRMRIAHSATATNPKLMQMDEELATMRQNILVSITSVNDGLQLRKQQLQNEEARLLAKIREIPTQEREYERICRERDIKQEAYLFLYQKREESDITLVSTAIPAKIIDRAQTIPSIVAPKIKFLLLFAILLGLVIPIGCIFLYDMWNISPTAKLEE